MLEMENNDSSTQPDFLYAAALSLIIAIVLIIVGAIIRSGTSPFSNLSGRNRIELISEGSANALTAGLLLGAVAALSFLKTDRRARTRPLLVGAFIVSAVIVLLAVYTVVDVLTMHVPGPDSSDFSIGLSQGSSMSDRLSIVLPQIGTVLIALVALIGTNRLGNTTTGGSESAGSWPDPSDDE